MIVCILRSAEGESFTLCKLRRHHIEIFTSTFPNQLGSFFRRSFSHVHLVSSVWFAGSVVSRWRFSAVVAFLFIQQASIPQGSRVEIRMSRESRAALALSYIAMLLGKTFNLGLCAKIGALWRLFLFNFLFKHESLVLVFLSCKLTWTIVSMA